MFGMKMELLAQARWLPAAPPVETRHCPIRITVHHHASGAEILEYFKKTVRKWNLDRDLQLNTKVVGAEWHESEGMWCVEVENTRTEERRKEWCHVLISGQGVLV